MSDIGIWTEKILTAELSWLGGERIPIDDRTGQPTPMWWAELGARVTHKLASGDYDVRSDAGLDDVRLGVATRDILAPPEVVLLRLWFDRATRILHLTRVDADDPQDWLDRGDERRAAEAEERAELARLKAKYEST